MATCGIAAGARTVMNTLIEKLEKEKIPAVVTQGGCMGYCYAEPTIEVKVPGKDPVVFGKVDAAVAEDIVVKYIKNGELIDGIIPVNYQSFNEQK
jgi:NADP-reducing hydrogenase subunit HndB